MPLLLALLFFFFVPVAHAQTSTSTPPADTDMPAATDALGREQNAATADQAAALAANQATQ